MFGLEQGAAVLKEINKEMSLEKVEKLMEDTADAIAYQEALHLSTSADVTGSIEFAGHTDHE